MALGASGCIGRIVQFLVEWEHELVNAHATRLRPLLVECSVTEWSGKWTCVQLANVRSTEIGQSGLSGRFARILAEAVLDESRELALILHR